jgi:hypothetical protein
VLSLIQIIAFGANLRVKVAALTAEDVVRRITAECAYVGEVPASAFASSWGPRSSGAKGSNFDGRRGGDSDRQSPRSRSE